MVDAKRAWKEGESCEVRKSQPRVHALVKKLISQLICFERVKQVAAGLHTRRIITGKFKSSSPLLRPKTHEIIHSSHRAGTTPAISRTQDRVLAHFT